MSSLINKLSGLRTFVEQRPALWRLAYRLMHTSSLFLPHDPTYYALKHLAQPEGGLILDIGANQGISALSFHKVCPKHQIISFEPNTVHEPNLKGVQRRIPNYTYHMVGLGDQPGEFTLYTPVYKGIYLHTASSLNEKGVRDSMDIFFPPAIRRDIQIVASTCVIRTLDEFQLKPQIIKIDAEGHESKILAGAFETLKRHMPALIFEACRGATGGGSITPQHIPALIREASHGDLSEVTHILLKLGYEIFSYSSEKDIFTPFDPAGDVDYIHCLRNLIAISGKARERLRSGEAGRVLINMNNP